MRCIKFARKLRAHVHWLAANVHVGSWPAKLLRPQKSLPCQEAFDFGWIPMFMCEFVIAQYTYYTDYAHYAHYTLRTLCTLRKLRRLCTLHILRTLCT